MKTMNKYLKVVLCFIAFVFCSFMLVLSPSISAVSAMEYTEAEYNLAINAIKMPTKINAEKEQFLIPFQAAKEANKWGEAANAEITQIVRVVDPSGVAHDYTIGGDDTVNDYNYFSDAASTESEEEANKVAAGFVRVNALNNDNYQIVYITKTKIGDETKTYYSNIYNVTVENVSYELDFTNDEGLTNLYKSEVEVNSGEIEVFSVKAKSGKTTRVLSPEECVSVVKNGAPQELDATGSDFYSRTVGTGDNAVVKYFINPTATGEYEIEYLFKESSNRPIANFTITVLSDKEYKEGVNPTAETPNIPSMELGQKGIVLPKLTVNNSISKNIAHNVTKIVIQKQYSQIKQELPANTYTFDFTLDKFTGATSYEDLVGIYEVTYYFQDAFGNVEGHTGEKTIRTGTISVSEKSNPSVYLSYNYDITTDESALEGKNDFSVNGDVVTKYADTELKSTYGCDVVNLPAMYGTDNLTETKDLIFVRYLENTNPKNSNLGKYFYIDNVKVVDGKLVALEYGDDGYNYAFQTDENDKTTRTGTPNRAQDFKFTASGSAAAYVGEYYLRYEVISTTVKDRTGVLCMPGTDKPYAINVKETVGEDSKVSVEIKNLTNTSIRPEKGVKFTVSSTDEKELDKAIKNAAFYFTSKLDDDDEVAEVTEDIFKADVNTAFLAAKADIENKINVLDSDAFKNEMIALGYKNFTVVTESETKNEFVVDKFDTAALKAGDANYATNNKVIIYAVALNDSAQFAYSSVVLDLKQTDEADAPVVDITNYGSLEASDKISDAKEFKQSDTITLPTIKYTDADKVLSMSVKYYIDSPETDAGLVFKTPDNVKFDLYNNTIVGGTLSKLATGNYYVVYTAIDDAGNTTVTYFTFTVIDSSKPILSVDVVSENEFSQSGNVITTDVDSILNFETLVRSGDGKFTNYNDISIVDIEISNENGLSAIPSGEAINSYKFENVGRYTVRISAYLNSVENKSGYWWIENTNTNIAATAENTPVIKDGYWWIDDTNTQIKVRTTDVKELFVEVQKPTLVWLEEFDVPKHAIMDSVVYLPYVAASHNAKVTVEVTAPGEKEAKLAESEVVNGYSVWKFKTVEGKKGTYTVKYIATSIYGELTKEFSIKVGDSVAPTISMEYENELSQNIVYTGSDIEYLFDVNKSISSRKFVITVNREGEQVYSYNLGLNFTDIDDSGTPSNNYTWQRLTYELKGDNVKKVDENKYTITGTGECTLVLTITDGYNNTTTKNIYFNVVTESEAEEVNNTVLGTVLIVISLVILAGVILFFIFTGNGKGGSKKSSKKIAKEIKETIEEKNANEDKVEEAQEEVKEVVEETKEEETTESSNDDEAKTGEVE